MNQRFESVNAALARESGGRDAAVTGLRHGTWVAAEVAKKLLDDMQSTPHTQFATGCPSCGSTARDPTGG